MSHDFTAPGQTSQPGDASAPGAERKWSPLAFALDRLFPRKEQAPYAPLERLVVLMVVRAMSVDRELAEFNCFLSYPTIARRSGISVASVKRMLQRHCDGPTPLVCRARTGQTRGHDHSCYRFTLVMHPERFAVARDAARAEYRVEAGRALRDLQPERIALQRQREDFGGSLTEREYQLRLALLEKPIRRKLAWASLTPTCPKAIQRRNRNEG